MADEPRETNEADGGEWEAVVWAAWIRGERNYAALGRQVGKHYQTVKRAIEKYSHAVALDAAAGGSSALGEYIAGLAADLTDAARMARDTSLQDTVRLGALKHVTTLREKLAAALGVVTVREGRELSGTIRTAVAAVSEVLNNADATEHLCAAEEALAADGDSDAGGVRQNTD